MNKLPYKVRFKLNYLSLSSIMKWCQQNCSGRFSYQYTDFIYHFENEADAVLFSLKFS